MTRKKKKIKKKVVNTRNKSLAASLPDRGGIRRKGGSQSIKKTVEKTSSSTILKHYTVLDHQKVSDARTRTRSSSLGEREGGVYEPNE